MSDNMTVAWKIFWVVLAVMITICLMVIAGEAISRFVAFAPAKADPQVDYNAIVIILLTTVTVIFSFCAVVLAIIGIIGFRNLKINAGRYAESQVIRKVEGAFKEDGIAIERIDVEFRKEDGHFRPWMKERIRKEVIALLPLFAERIPAQKASIAESAQGFATDEPTDEGETE